MRALYGYIACVIVVVQVCFVSIDVVFSCQLTEFIVGIAVLEDSVEIYVRYIPVTVVGVGIIFLCLYNFREWDS